jgi:hypothetical protein
MFGTFQQSQLRIEVPASEQNLRESLVNPAQLQQWLFPLQLTGSSDRLQVGSSFTSSIGPLAVRHTVESVGSNRLRLLLSQGIDGLHEWQWGEGWVQSRLEGVSLLPLNLGQTLSLLRLRQFLVSHS